jgi:hypothetical protein
MSTTRATRCGCDEVDDVSNAMDVARVAKCGGAFQKKSAESRLVSEP